MTFFCVGKRSRQRQAFIAAKLLFPTKFPRFRNIISPPRDEARSGNGSGVRGFARGTISGYIRGKERCRKRMRGKTCYCNIPRFQFSMHASSNRSRGRGLHQKVLSFRWLEEGPIFQRESASFHSTNGKDYSEYLQTWKEGGEVCLDRVYRHQVIRREEEEEEVEKPLSTVVSKDGC